MKVVVVKHLNCWIFWTKKMHATFMNLVVYNWSLAAEFFYMENYGICGGWNSSGKHVNSQLKINGIGITKFLPSNEVSWLHFSGRLVEIRGYIYRVYSWLKILLIQVEIRLNFSRFGGFICCVLVLIDSPVFAAYG